MIVYDFVFVLLIVEAFFNFLFMKTTIKLINILAQTPLTPHKNQIAKMFDSATCYVNGCELWSLRVSGVVLVCCCVVIVWSFRILVPGEETKLLHILIPHFSDSRSRDIQVAPYLCLPVV